MFLVDINSYTSANIDVTYVTKRIKKYGQTSLFW